MKTNEEIKNKISEIRRKKGLSQESMSIMLRISMNSYRKIEKGNTILISKWLWEVAKILKITVEELILDNNSITGKSLADEERDAFISEIESLRKQNIFLQQHIELLNERSADYLKKARGSM